MTYTETPYILDRSPRNGRMSRLPWLAAIALLFASPLALAAGATGEITSDAPVRLHGGGKAVGEDLTLYHDAFRDGSVSGKVYSGLVIQHERIHVKERQPPTCQQFEGDESSETGPTADPNLIYTVIDYSLTQGAFARLRFPNDLLFSVGDVGATPDASQAFLYLGPNPYAATGGSRAENVPDDFTQAFATDPFVAVPAGSFNTVGPFTLELQWGELKTFQRERERVFKAGVFDEQREASPSSPVSGAVVCDVSVVRWVDFEQTVVVASIDQSDAERPLAYWSDGQPGTRDDAPPIGYWALGSSAGFASARQAARLPATVVAAPQFHIALEGEAHFDHALGSVSTGGHLYEAKDAALALDGHPDLEPSASESGHRMTTKIGGDVAAVEVGTVKSDGLRWTLDVPMTLGIVGAAAVLGGGAWAWPALKFKGTQWMLFPLYARLKKEDLLENPLRDDILEVVQQQPGISASELGRRLECGWGTLVYHLTVLERMQLLSSAREGRHKRFFVQGRINYSDKAAVGLLANASARTILDAVKERPGLIQRDLGRLLGLSPGTVAWHVERLAEAGLIIKEEDGRVVRYYPSAKLIELTRQLAA